MKIKELASTLGEQPKSIRSYLRRTHPRPVDKSNQPWEDLSPEVCKETSNYFHILREQQPKERAKEKHLRKAKEKAQGKPKIKMSKEERIKLELEGRIDLNTGELLSDE